MATPCSVHGYGTSPSSSGISAADYLRRTLHKDKIILVGHSLGSIVGVHQGTAVRETRFGTLWRSSYGIVVLVSGDSPTARLSAIDGVRIDP